MMAALLVRQAVALKPLMRVGNTIFTPWLVKLDMTTLDASWEGKGEREGKGREKGRKGRKGRKREREER